MAMEMETLAIKIKMLSDTDLILDNTSESPVVINRICWRESDNDSLRTFARQQTTCCFQLEDTLTTVNHELKNFKKA